MFPKLRLSDVIDKNASFLESELFNYFTRSHFDFLITTPEAKPIMAIEFDGPFHSNPAQIARDAKKHFLCKEATLPILRINANHVFRKYRGMTLLRWIIEVIQLQEWFNKAQEKGEIPADEPFDPMAIVSDGAGRNWPYWLSANAMARINKFVRHGDETAWITLVGEDDDRKLHSLEYIRIGDEILHIRTSVRSQDADVPIFDMIREVTHYEMGEKLTRFLQGEEQLLATTRGPLIIASSPYARRGVVWESYKRNFKPDGDPLVLIAQGASRRFNPSLRQAVVDREYERDPASAAAEYGGNFRIDIEAFVSIEIVEACLGDHHELLPAHGIKYHAFCDPSGGSQDSMTLAVVHKDADKVIVDCVRERRAPFSPDSVIEEFVPLLKSYRCFSVTGDRFGGEWCREPFKKAGITYRLADKPKSDLYRDCLPLLNSGKIVLPKNQRLIDQFTGLERRTSRGGRDSIDHAPGAHDDVCNAAAVVGCTRIAKPRVAPVPASQQKYC